MRHMFYVIIWLQAFYIHHNISNKNEKEIHFQTILN